MDRRFLGLKLLVGISGALAAGGCNATHIIGDTGSTGGSIGVASGGANNAFGGAPLSQGGTSAISSVATRPGGAPSTGGAGPTGGQLGTGGSNPSSSGGASTGGAPPSSCTDTLEGARHSSFIDCPATLCEARTLALSCANQTLSNYIGSCEGCTRNNDCFDVVAFDWGTHTQYCHYPRDGYDRLTNLIGVTLEDDVPSYCSGTSRSIKGGTAPATCDLNSATRIDCSGSNSGGTGGSGATGDAGVAPPNNCYNNFMGMCTPCCPGGDLDCTGKPEGYPGYQCTPTSRDYCMCYCTEGQMRCIC